MSRELEPIPPRREDVAAIPLRLADGRDWWFATPIERFRPVFGGGGRVVGVSRNMGPPGRIAPRLASLRDAIEADDEGRAREAMLDVATGLLLAAHDVDPDSARMLLARSLDDAPGLIDDILTIALGEPTATGEPAR